MKFYPLDFEILNALASTSTAPAQIQPLDIPGRVIVVLPSGHAELQAAGSKHIQHNKGFRFVDRDHDWSMQKGKFYFYSHDLAPSKGADDSAAEKVQVMIVYKWLEISMDSNGDPEGRSKVNAVSRGIPMSIEINKDAKNTWQATLSLPSLGRVSLDEAADIAQSQLDLIKLGNAELERRQMNLPIEDAPDASENIFSPAPS